jgi:hypothetical protein
MYPHLCKGSAVVGACGGTTNPPFSGRYAWCVYDKLVRLIIKGGRSFQPGHIGPAEIEECQNG